MAKLDIFTSAKAIVDSSEEVVKALNELKSSSKMIEDIKYIIENKDDLKGHLKGLDEKFNKIGNELDEIFKKIKENKEITSNYESKIKEILNSNLDVMNKELKIEVQTMVEKSIENKIVELSIQIQEVKKILFGIAIIIGLGIISILLF